MMVKRSFFARPLLTSKLENSRVRPRLLRYGDLFDIYFPFAKSHALWLSGMFEAACLSLITKK
jgi:hypothetical protein